ncbi:uncharacterized protein FOMMEDRAFT_170658 [Fomitiporia mediterranea MF3/22]|uniref:uncharacterized protein n=1 Tax=Fomitiporia mediterranea (strain MF3/22) TaxID=694068 RepID=UPI000440947D|nr:uncharacterized protein FOMMEDRAFT_170658 [Fomitiporia mediterranea MF3/22]EJC99381.1 hypothetical protein FOMMEDRAFT_170658 [Fomitiporia mediterranea MF3/22]
MAPIGILLSTVFGAILEVFLLCLAGYILSRRGILDKKTQKQINRLNVSLFTPSLLFSKVAFSLTPAKLRELWIIPIFFFVVTGVSMGISYILGLIFRLKKSQRNFAIAAAMFMNSNSLPIALMQSLVVAVPNLKWEDDDTKNSMLGRALSYLVLSSTLGMVLRWSYGVHLLSQADPEGSDSDNHEYGSGSRMRGERYTDNPETQPLLVDLEEDTQPSTTRVHHQTPSIICHEHQDDEESSIRVKASHPRGWPEIRPQVFYSFPNTPTRSYANLLDASTNPSSATLAVPFVNTVRPPNESDFESDTDEPLFLPSTTHHERLIAPPPISTKKSLLRRIGRRVRKFLKAVNSFMSVPLWAALLSLIVVLIPPLQHTVDYHMQPFKGALAAAGNCSIPLTLVVLGAYFYKPPVKDEKRSSEHEHSDGNASTEQNGHTERDTSRRSDRSTSSFVGSVRSTMMRLSRLDRWEANRSKDKSKKAKPRPGETRTVVIAVVSRMVLTPLVLLPLMALGARYDNPKVFDDPVFIVSNVLLVSSPPALTLAQMTQAASGDAFERLISRTIFWSYCIVTPPATILYVVLGLLVAKL